MSFSPTDATFEGFRVVRRAPLTILFWSLIYLAAFAVTFIAVGPSLAGLMAMAERMQGAEPGFAEFEALGRAFGWIFGVAAPIMLAMGAVLNAAVARSVLRPSEKAFGYVRVGADELRVLATTLILSLVIFVLTMGLYLVLALLGFAAYSSGQGWLWLIVVLGALAAIGLVVWLSVRWSLAVPIAMAEKRIAPFASFALTKGRFWPLLGMALLAGVMSILVSLLASIVAMPVTLIVGDMDKLAAYEGQNVLTILTGAWPLLLGWTIVNAVTTSLQLAVMYAPFSAAYLAIKGQTAEA